MKGKGKNGAKGLVQNLINQKNPGKMNPNNKNNVQPEPVEESYESYYESTSNSAVDDPDNESPGDYRKGGYHPVNIGDKFNNGVYEVKAKLGWGHFSTVWLAHDSAANQFVALKIQKSAKNFTEAARDEIDLLTRVTRLDPVAAKAVVRLLDHFEHSGPHGVHVCMVYELLGPNLLKHIEKYHHTNLPVKLSIVKHVARQLLIGLEFLHDKCGIIHTDLKPENIAFTTSVNHQKLGVTQTTSKVKKLGKDGPYGKRNLPTYLPAGVPEDCNIPPFKANKGVDGVKMTKNQKKKLKQKEKKKAAKAALLSGSTDPTKPGETAADNAAESPEKPDQKSPENDLDDEEDEQDEYDLFNGLPKEMDPNTTFPSRIPVPDKEWLKEHKEWPYVPGELSALRPSFLPPSSMNSQLGLTSLLYTNFSVKIIDLGNGCWIDHHYTDDIQTRQYRAPEVIIGSSYGPSCDIWSLACIIFEMLTDDFLFDPADKGKSATFSREDDHLAQITELIGKSPKHFALSGKNSTKYFNKNGEIKNIPELNPPWALNDILIEKYDFPKKEANEIASFLLPMLNWIPEKRATARDLLSHPWIAEPINGNDLTADDLTWELREESEDSSEYYYSEETASTPCFGEIGERREAAFSLETDDESSIVYNTLSSPPTMESDEENDDDDSENEKEKTEKEKKKDAKNAAVDEAMKEVANKVEKLTIGKGKTKQ